MYICPKRILNLLIEIYFLKYISIIYLKKVLVFFTHIGFFEAILRHMFYIHLINFTVTSQLWVELLKVKNTWVEPLVVYKGSSVKINSCNLVVHNVQKIYIQ